MLIQHMRHAGRTVLTGLLLLAGACTPVKPGSTPQAVEDTTDWALYGHDSHEQRFSPLSRISTENIGQLGLAWSMDLPKQARSLQGTPLAVDGTLYFATALSVVYAVDAVTGSLLWTYDPEVGKVNPRALRTSHGVNRGVGYFEGLVIVGALDGRVIALDSRTGKPRWTARSIDEADSRKVISGAPRVFDGKVIVGNSGADFGTRGYVTTFDARTGKLLWRFYTVPGNPANGFEDEAQAMAARTWSGEWWRWGGGGTVWNAMTYDRELKRVYIGVGNSSNYNPDQRSPGDGDNLFLASIVALDAETGKYIWHYQVNPREAWDFKATADIVLATLTIDGKPRRVLMQAPTNGFFYVIDRDTGKLISAEKIGKVTWASHIDLATGRPVENPGVRYKDGPVTFWPSPMGIHNWQAMAFNPQLGLVYIPTLKLPGTYWTNEQKAKEAEQFTVGSRHYEISLGSQFALAKVDPDDGTGGLLAWDPAAQRARWSLPLKWDWNGGTLATAGNLVFQGTGDGWFHAFDARDGKELWTYNVRNGVQAPPITYSVRGQQYVTLLVGYGAAAPTDPGWRYGKHLPRILTFRLGGTAQLPATPGPDFSVKPIDNPSERIDEASAARGIDLWARNCAVCHSLGAGTANWPDLRESPLAHDYDTLHTILREGSLSPLGMPQFDEFSDDQIRDINMAVKLMSRRAAHGDFSIPEGARRF